MISGHKVLEVLPVFPALLPCQGGDCLQPSPRGRTAGTTPLQGTSSAILCSSNLHGDFKWRETLHIPTETAVVAQLLGVGEWILLLASMCLAVAGWCVIGRLQDCCVLQVTPAEFGCLKEKGNLCQKILYINRLQLGLVVTYWCIGMLLIHLKLFIYGAS